MRRIPRVLCGGVAWLACTAAAVAALPSARVLQAEDGNPAGGATAGNDIAGYRGSGHVRLAAAGSGLTWDGIDGGPGGGVWIVFRHALAAEDGVSAELAVNGVSRRIRFNHTGGAGDWGESRAFVRLAAGSNTLSLTANGDAGTIDEASLSAPAPVRVPTAVYWGGYRGMEQLVGAGATQWPTVLENQDGLLLHGAYWGNPASTPDPAVVGPQLAALVAGRNQRPIMELGFPGEYPRIDSPLGAVSVPGAIDKMERVVSWGFPRPDVSTDFHMFTWRESMRHHPEWNDEEFFTALCGNWESYNGSQLNPAGSDRTTYGWFRQWTEGLASRYPGIRVTATNSPVYFNWNDKLELGDDYNTHEAWLKLERHGPVVEAFWSATGTSWVSLGSASTALSGSVAAGLAVSSRNPARLATARFDSHQVYDYFFQDIGRPGRGGFLVASGGDYTLTGNGDHTTFGKGRDNHFLVYRDWNGDGEFVARLSSLANTGNPGRTSTQAGIEIRESLADNSRLALLVLNLGGKALFQTRATAGSNLTTIAQPVAPVPGWLKLTRAGTSVTAAYSGDGAAWTTIGTGTVSMPAAVKVGLLCDSSVYWESATAGFGDVGFLSASAHSAAWSAQDIGAPALAGANSGTGTLTVDAAGSDIGGTGDQCRFVSKPLAADGTVVARCLAFADKLNSSFPLDPVAKMGVMLRGAAAPGARHAMAAFTPASGIQRVERANDGGTTIAGATWGAGEARVISKNRTAAHYLTGNDFLAALGGAFPGVYRDNYAGFTTDSPFTGYMRWGGSETNADAMAHREKIRQYEAWLQERGFEHQLIANDNTTGPSGTQGEKDAWDLAYKLGSLRSIQLHQIEGGRPDRVLFESWYDGPFSLVPETKEGSFANLVRDGLRYLKGTGQQLDLLARPSDQASFAGDNIYQPEPAGVQRLQWRAQSPGASRGFVLRLANDGQVSALPVLQAHCHGDAAWAVTYEIAGVDVTAAITGGEGLVLTDSATRGQELIAPGATVDLTVTVTAGAPSGSGEVWIRAFWNPQDPGLTAKDSIALVLLPPNAEPVVAVPALATAAPGVATDIDLRRFVGDEETPVTGLWFSVGTTGDGSIELLEDGHTARFTPAAGATGPAAFGFTVRDAFGDSRLLRHFPFEPPDEVADAQATDVSSRAVAGDLSQAGSGSFSYETGAARPLAATQSRCLRLIEVDSANHARLRSMIPSAEHNLSTSDWTVSMWFKRAGTATHDFLCYLGSGNGFSGDGHELELFAPANQNRITLQYWDGGNTKVAWIDSPLTVSPDTWHHAALAWDADGTGSGTMTLHLDGVAAGSATFAAAFKQSQPWVIGGIQSTAPDPRNLDGWLDDVAMFGVALTGEEVSDLARMPVATLGGKQGTGIVTVMLDPLAGSLRARWPFDADLTDVSGNGWNLGVAGDALVTAVNAKQGSGALALDGSGDNGSTAGNFPLGEAFTIAAWVYIPSGVGTIQTVAANSTGGFNANGLRFMVNSHNTGDGKLILETGNGTHGVAVASAAGTVAFDRWQHVAAVVNRGSGSAVLYRNGTVVATGSVRADFANEARLFLGAMANASNALRTRIDDARVDGRALSAAEIASMAGESDRSPVIGPLSDIVVAAGESSAPLQVTVDDAETDAGMLVLTAASDNPGLLPPSGMVLGGGGANRTLTVTPVAWSAGVAVVSLTVSDGLSTSTTSFRLTVTNSGGPAKWTGTVTSGPSAWSVGANWQAGNPPYPAPATTLDFLSGVGLPAGTIDTWQDVAFPFRASKLVCGGLAPPSGTAEVRVNGGTIELTSDGAVAPLVSLDAPAGVIYQVFSPIILAGATTVAGSGGGVFRWSGELGGSGGLTKSGSSTLALAGAGTRGGPTLLAAGVLAVGDDSALGSGKLTLQGGSLRADGTAARAIHVPVDVAAHTTIGGSGSGDLVFGTAGGWRLVGATRILTVDTITATIAGVIGEDAGGRGLTKAGNGRLVLSGMNTYTGATRIEGGVLRAGSSGATGAAGSNIYLLGGTNTATLELTGGIGLTRPLRIDMHNNGAGHSQVRNLAGNNVLAGDITLEPGGGRWDIESAAGLLTISGNIRSNGDSTWRTLFLKGPGNGEILGNIGDPVESGRKVNVRVEGGTWAFGGNPKSFTGTTTVAAGTLVVDSTTVSPVTVHAEGALGGSGTIHAPVTVNGSIAPGGAGVGTLTVGSLVLAANARCGFQVAGWSGAAGVAHDVIRAAALDLTDVSASMPLVIDVDTASATGFTDTGRVFPLLVTTGFVGGFSADKFKIEVRGFAGTGEWSVRQVATGIELVYQPDPYQAWIDGYPELSGAEREPGADPDHDLLENAVEHALGTDPRRGGSVGSVERVGTTLVYVFPRNTLATGSTITVEAAPDPRGPWSELARSSGGAPFTPLTGVAQAGESGSGAVASVTVTETLPDPVPSTRFVRLRVGQ